MEIETNFDFCMTAYQRKIVAEIHAWLRDPNRPSLDLVAEKRSGLTTACVYAFAMRRFINVLVVAETYHKTQYLVKDLTKKFKDKEIHRFFLGEHGKLVLNNLCVFQTDKKQKMCVVYLDNTNFDYETRNFCNQHRCGKVLRARTFKDYASRNKVAIISVLPFSFRDGDTACRMRILKFLI